jgi:Peptidase family M50
LGAYLMFAGLGDTLLWLIDPRNYWTIAQVVLGLGFVIFVHELGHFIVAKMCGVKCEKFYLGFDVWGLKLAKFQWGETEYGIGILPLGGYVKMLGQDDNPYRAADEMKRARATEAAKVAVGTASASAGSAEGHHMPGGDLPPEPTAGPHPPYDPDGDHFGGRDHERDFCVFDGRARVSAWCEGIAVQGVRRIRRRCGMAVGNASG